MVVWTNKKGKWVLWVKRVFDLGGPFSAGFIQQTLAVKANIDQTILDGFSAGRTRNIRIGVPLTRNQGMWVAWKMLDLVGIGIIYRHQHGSAMNVQVKVAFLAVERKNPSSPPTGIAQEKPRIIWGFGVEGEGVLWVERVVIYLRWNVIA